jgi:hypothetical protein
VLTGTAVTLIDKSGILEHFAPGFEICGILWAFTFGRRKVIGRAEFVRFEPAGYVLFSFGITSYSLG